MKNLMMMAITIVATLPAFAQFGGLRPGQDGPGRGPGGGWQQGPGYGGPGYGQPQTCSCVELQRRISGLSYVLNYGGCHDPREANMIRSQINSAQASLNQSQYEDYRRQEQTCSLANQNVNESWVRWQPWVARNGADTNYGCN